MKVSVREADPRVVPYVLANLRGDQRELVSEGLMATEEMQRKVMASRHCRIGMADDRVAVLWGVLVPSFTDGSGLIWAVTTPVADEYPLIFARHSKIEVQKLLPFYSELKGYVNAEYERSIRWLKWLGFDVGPKQSFHGMKVRMFSMKGEM